MNYLYIIGLILTTFLIGMLYWRKYYSGINLMLKGENNNVLHISPLVFNTFLLLILLFSLGIFSMVRVEALESENKILKKELESDIFDDGNFPNQTIRTVYEEYNVSFAGYYINAEGIYVVCITNSSPVELIDLLTNENIKYILVSYSYTQLREVFKILSLNIEENGFLMVGLDIRNNVIEVGISDINQDLDIIQAYIDEGIVIIKVTDPIIPY